MQLIAILAILKITAINNYMLSIWIHTFTGCIKNKNNLEPVIIGIIWLHWMSMII